MKSWGRQDWRTSGASGRGCFSDRSLYFIAISIRPPLPDRYSSTAFCFSSELYTWFCFAGYNASTPPALYRFIHFIRQRQAEGIAAAKARGVKFGRRPMKRPAEFESMRREWEAGRISARKAAIQLGITHRTFLKWAVENNLTDEKSID